LKTEREVIAENTSFFSAGFKKEIPPSIIYWILCLGIPLEWMSLCDCSSYLPSLMDARRSCMDFLSIKTISLPSFVWMEMSPKERTSLERISSWFFVLFKIAKHFSYNGFSRLSKIIFILWNKIKMFLYSFSEHLREFCKTIKLIYERHMNYYNIEQ